MARLHLVLACCLALSPAAVGCGSAGLAAYAPTGPQGSTPIPITQRLYAVVLDPNTHEDAEYASRWYWESVLQRPDLPAFRAVCGLLNGHFTQWSRLILIERIAYYRDPMTYDFLLLAVTPGGPAGVTNLRWTGRRWEAGVALVPLPIERPMLEAALRDLDSARREMPRALICHLAHDHPFFVLHDITRDKGAWVCAIQGRDLDRPTTTHGPGETLDYEEAGRGLRDLGDLDVVPAAQRQRFNLASDRYAALMARLWGAALGCP